MALRSFDSVLITAAKETKSYGDNTDLSLSMYLKFNFTASTFNL